MYAFKTYISEPVMPRTAVEQNSRIALRVRPEEKATIMQAAALAHTDITTFVVQNILQIARETIVEAERLQLSERDSRRVLDLLEHPPKPNERLLAAARALPKDT
jgi:uncharacterized protein (DUF1778 family)